MNGIVQCCRNDQDHAVGAAVQNAPEVVQNGERQGLLQNQAQVAERAQRGACTMCKKPITILIAGIFIAFITIGLIWIFIWLKLQYEADITNLEYYG